MAQYFKGSFLAALQWEENDFDPVRGYIYRAAFKGLNADNVQSITNDLIAQGIACRIRTEFGVTTLEAVDSTQEYTLDAWDLDGNEERFDLFSHPTIIDIFGPYSSYSGWQNFTSLKGDLEDNTDPQDLYNALTGGGISPDDAATVVRFYLLYLRGTTEYENDTDGTGYVLKHTTNVSNKWTVNIADVNVGRIYTTAELLSEVSDSSLWINPLDARRQYKIANIPAASPQENYLWGWKKTRSTEGTAANNRVNINTNYTLALWSTDLYQPTS